MITTAVTTSKRDEIVKLRETGLTYAEIGRRLGISRERVRQIITGNPRLRRSNSKVMLKIDDVAQLLNVHINTVRRWSNQGILKAYRIGSRGDRRFKREDIDDLIQEAKSTKH